jgi:apoptosis-stimulating of p53 protein 1
MTHSSPTPPTTLPIIQTKSSIDMTDSSNTEEQLLPAKLRLNDDILSVHFNSAASNIKKRHSLSDPIDSLMKYLPSNTEQQQEPILVHDDSSLSDAKPIIVAYENLLDIINNKSDDEEQQQPETIIESFISDTDSQGSLSEDIQSMISFSTPISNLKSLLKTPTTPKNTSRRVVFDPLALLLDAAVLGDLELLIKSAKQVRILSFFYIPSNPYFQVKNPSQPNDEGLTALHNAVCASNMDCIKFLVEFGCNINYSDNDGWTPLHCAASCNNFLIVKFLIEHGACIYATTIRDNETAADKCEEEEDNYIYCSQYLLSKN